MPREQLTDLLAKQGRVDEAIEILRPYECDAAEQLSDQLAKRLQGHSVVPETAFPRRCLATHRILQKLVPKLRGDSILFGMVLETIADLTASDVYDNTVRIGYARVSNSSPGPTRPQRDELAAAHCREVIVETASTPR
jgi:hypothetical protein